MRRILALAFCLSLAALAWAQAGASVAAEMAAAAGRLLAALEEGSRAALAIPFADAERLNWHYIPRERRGAPFKQLTPAQRELADALLRSGLSPEGLKRAANIRQLDQVLFEESHNPIRDPDLYFLSVFGEPGGRGEWGWRVEGHHLSLNFTLRDGRVVSATPSFFGANPAEVRRGPHQGLRTLAPEEDLGRALYRSLEGALRQKALLSAEAPADIVTGNAKQAELGAPAGVALAEVSPAQRAALMELVEMYAHRLRRELAEEELARLRAAGLEKIHFAWAGVSEPGQPHYYRIQGPTFVVEYDNTQNNANHIHTVWRNFATDFGLDPLRAHYRTSPHHRAPQLAASAAPPHRKGSDGAKPGAAR